MATVRGTATNPNYSQRWIYADFYNLIWDSSNNAFRYSIDLYSQYQHQRSAYQNVYSLDNVTVTYTVTNANVNGTSRSVTSVAYSPRITYLQYTGQQWKATTYVWLPKDVTSKTCTISAPNPNWAYSFWNYAVSGTITTPTVSWAAPSASMSVINNTPGTVKLDGSYTINGTLATLSSAVIYCDTNSNPTTVRSDNVAFSVNHNTKYYWKYVVTDNHGKSTTKTGNFTTVGNAPTISSTSISGLSTNGATINYNVSYDTNASYSSREIQYGTTTSYGTNTTSNILSGLSSDTTYYYRIRVTDNFGRTSGWSTGSFITHPNTVQVLNPQVTNITPFECTLSMNSSDPSNTEYSSYSIYNYDKSIKLLGPYDDTPPVYSKVISGLEPNTNYWAAFNLKTSRSGEWDTVSWVSFTTLSDAFCRLI
jgi:hypothetical protein